MPRVGRGARARFKEHWGSKSLTDLKMLHGVLNNPEMAGRAYFLLPGQGLLPAREATIRIDIFYKPLRFSL